MALTERLNWLFGGAAIIASAILVAELWRWHDVREYNAAIGEQRYADAADRRGEFGVFAIAYAAQQSGDYQLARTRYNEIEDTPDRELRLAVLFNLGNSYLQQAATVDLAKDADLAAPLIELAKGSYRQLLAIEPGHWPAKYNLERALVLLPDSRTLKLMDLEGRRNPVRTVISADPEENLP